MKTMRIALVVPNYRWSQRDERFLWKVIPYNLCLIAAMLRDDYEVRIIDAYAENMDEDSFKNIIGAFEPDVVGITVLMDQCAPAGHLAAKFVKSVDRDIKVVMGGVYATVNPDRVISDENIDYAVVGEGEYVFRDLAGFFAGRNPLPSRGICFRDGTDIVSTPKANYINNLDALPLPAYDLIDYRSYANKAERRSVDSPSLFPYGRVLTSRGCPYGCCFCQVEIISGSRFRPRSADNVLEEIAWLKETYGIKALIFDDDNLFTEKKRALAILKGMIERGLAMPWKSIATAVFRLDAQLIEVMKASGCEYIDVAIESGTERVLKEIIRKPVNLTHAKEIVSLAKASGIFVAANFIIGFPTETWDEIRQTLRFAQEMDADYMKIFAAMPLRHTRLWELCLQHGAFKEGFELSNMSWYVGQIETKEFSSNSLSILRAYEWDRINFTSPDKRRKIAKMMGIDEDELKEIRRETFKKVISQIQNENRR